MLAVNCDEATAQAACDAEPGKLWLAVLNARGRQVIAGEPGAVSRAAVTLKEKQNIGSRPLPVNRAYHTPLMASTQARLAALLERMPLSPPSVRLCCNGSGGWMEDSVATDAAYWAAHVASAVRWADNMDALASRASSAPAPPTLVVELGSGSTLAPLLAECTHADAEQLRPIPTLRHPKVSFDAGLADQQVFGEALGSLWEAGAPVKWGAYHDGERYVKLPLPSYAFEKDVHWANDDASMYIPSTADALAAAEAS